LDRNDDSKVNAIDLVDFIACAAASGPSIPAGPACGGTVLFQDDFDAGNSTANWTLKTTSADNTVNFAYDYSTAGIPPAPRTKGGTTKGAFMSVNDDATATVEAAIAYANTVDFTNDFTLTFDMWMNYSGVATTEFSVFGINGDGTSILVPTLGVNSPPTAGTGPTSAGYLFSVDGESGTVRDYRVYEGAVELLGASGGLIAPAGNQDASSSTPYSLIFPAPKSLFLGAPGNNGPGNGWGWARVEIKHTATGIVTWKLNDTVVATRSATAYPSGKIMIGYMDMFSSISSAGTYVVYDNVLVTAP